MPCVRAWVPSPKHHPGHVSLIHHILRTHARGHRGRSGDSSNYNQITRRTTTRGSFAGANVGNLLSGTAKTSEDNVVGPAPAAPNQLFDRQMTGAGASGHCLARARARE